MQGRREWGAVSLSRENLLPFLYKLHYSMHLPEVGGFELGVWFMGLIAMAWVLDTLIALWISFPTGARGDVVRFPLGRGRPQADLRPAPLRRRVALALVLMLAVTSVSMNLSEEVMRPLVSLFSDAVASRRLPAARRRRRTSRSSR